MSYSPDDNPFGEPYGYDINRQAGIRSSTGSNNSATFNGQQTRPSYNPNTDEKIKKNKEQIRDLTKIMEDNINRAMDRDIRLSDLNRNAEDLEYRATDFKRTSNRAKNHFFTKNMKWTIILIAVVLIILLIIGLIIGVSFGLNRQNNG